MVDIIQKVTYRYTTIVFGLSSSQFILNYIIENHLEKFKNKLTTKVLNKCLYVDNSLYTNSDSNNLGIVYRYSIERMGGIQLCFWNSNLKNLKEQYELNLRAKKQKTDVERVLGHKHLVENFSPNGKSF